MNQKKFDAIREGARKLRESRETRVTEGATETPEMQVFESVDAVLEATRKAK